jgi:hypothetical protein
MSKLTPEQQEWYREKFGVRYSHVQDTPLQPSRRVRRGRGDRNDAKVLEYQKKVLAHLSSNPIKAKVP